MEGNAKLVKEPQVNEEIGFLNDCTGKLLEIVDTLETRLTKITRGPDETGAGEGKPEAELVPLAETIKAQRRRVVKAISQIDSVLRRLEL